LFTPALFAGLGYPGISFNFPSNPVKESLKGTLLAAGKAYFATWHVF